MPSPFTFEDFTAREEILAADLVRMQKLSSRALQEELYNRATDSNNAPINCFSRVPTMTSIVATFNATLSFGEALVYDTTGVTADDSNFQVLQWPAQDITFANPNGANPRIDLVVATHATVDGDVQSRNILVDPIARTVVPANVAKTTMPTATIAIVTGTAAANPASPAVPAGAVAMFEVLVPAAAPDSTTFLFIPRLFKLATYPFTGSVGHAAQTGVIRGCTFTYVGGATAAVLSSTENAVLIDGEVIEFSSTLIATNDASGGQNPFAGAAPAGNDVPYYLYVVGGRNLPSVNALTNPSQPVVLVASTIAPNLTTGRPSSAIGAPRGSTTSACYVGLGFVLKGTTNHQKCVQVGDYIWWASTAGDLAFENPTAVVAPSGPAAYALPSAPSFTTEAHLGISTAGASTLVQISPGTAATHPVWTAQSAAAGFLGNAIVPVQSAAIGLTIVTNNVTIFPFAYKMSVRRFG
jgi:hypothetical protein